MPCVFCEEDSFNSIIIDWRFCKSAMKFIPFPPELLAATSASLCCCCCTSHRLDSFWHPSGGFCRRRRRHRFRRAKIRKNGCCSGAPHRRPSAVRVDSWPSCPSLFVAADSSFRRKRWTEKIAGRICLRRPKIPSNCGLMRTNCWALTGS